MAKNMGGGFGDLGGVMKQAQQMLKQREKIMEELRERVEEGTAGGGMVTAYVNGAREMVKITLEPQVIDPDDREMLEDLIVAAVNEATRKAQELADKEMGKLTGGIPGMQGLLG